MPETKRPRMPGEDGRGCPSDDALAEAKKYKDMYEEATEVPSVGTQVGAAGRANSWRIDSDQSVSPAVTKIRRRRK